FAVTDALTRTDDASRNMNAVRDTLSANYNGDPFQRVLYIESHDTAGNGGARLPGRIDARAPQGRGARHRSVRGAVILLTAPGVPMIFMGQEMLERQKFTDPAPYLDWNNRVDHAPFYLLYREMISLRRNREGRSGGLLGTNMTVTHINDSAKVIG